VSLATLLLALRPLLADPKGNISEINRLLGAARDQAELQVARFFVFRELMPKVDELIRSADPRERLEAVETLRTCAGLTDARRLARRVVKDSDVRVRGRARAAVRAMGIDDVALPDNRYTGRWRRGQYNVTGWAFGLFAWHRDNDRKPPKPLRTKPLSAFRLPELSSVDDLADHVGIEPDALARLMRPGSESGSAYVEFEIAKSSGGTRRIAAPRPPLRAVQQKIYQTILRPVAAHPAAHGFVPGRSTVSNAGPHVGAALLAKMDVEEFFPSIHYRRVAGLFRYIGYPLEVANALAGLTTHRMKLADGYLVWPGALPQGAPTSPAIANLVARRLDARLDALALKCGATYTRYADDLTFSFRAPPERGLGRFFWWAEGILHQEGFQENSKKRRVLRAHQQQRVTGVVVNQVPHVPREERRRIRAIVHNLKIAKAPPEGTDERERSEAYLRGYVAYVSMIQPELGANLDAQLDGIFGP
jgi:retron-type reverse transcriptase